MGVLRFATHLWFNDQATEAARLYTGLFPESHIDRIIAAPEGVPGSEQGGDFIVDLTLFGQQFSFLNGGPRFPFDSQVSLYVLCDTQDDLDRYWDALLEGGGHEVQCGWLTDRFGLSWQVIPRRLEELMSTPDHAAAARVTAAMLQMVKIDVAGLERAAAA